MYADFFTDGGREGADEDSGGGDDDRRPVPRAKRRNAVRRGARAGKAQVADEDGWDGEQLFDTGEGREGVRWTWPPTEPRPRLTSEELN